MFLSMNTIPDIEKLYASLDERDYEAVMSQGTTSFGSWPTIRRLRTEAPTTE